MELKFEGKWPNNHPKIFVAQNATVIGEVIMKEFSSLWFNTVLRADINRIEIGKYSNVQDHCVIHVAEQFPTIVGDFVTIGHNATLHGCVIQNNCLIGIGAVVLNGAIIGAGSIIAAGAVVKENEMIPPHSLVAGIPGKVIKSVQQEWNCIHYQAVKYKTLWTERYGIFPDAGGECYRGEQIV